MKRISLIAFILVFFQFSCNHEDEITVEEHQLEIAKWHQQQMESLKSENGWLNLVGLYWLEEGDHTFGSGSEMDFKIEGAQFPEKIGVFTLESDKVYFEPIVSGIQKNDIELDSKTLIFDPENGIAENLQFGSLKWVIIKRSEAYGVRLRDLEAREVTSFSGVDQFPVDLKWRIIANFVPYIPTKEISITNVIGQTTPNPSPGYLEFQVDGQTFKIDAIASDEDEELFLIFADETSGGETYGGGRYMYVSRPDKSGKVILDFNKAYNPPCVYTPHATCPLPPRQNMLSVAIEAGHKNFGDH